MNKTDWFILGYAAGVFTAVLCAAYIAFNLS